MINYPDMSGRMFRSYRMEYAANTEQMAAYLGVHRTTLVRWEARMDGIIPRPAAMAMRRWMSMQHETSFVSPVRPKPMKHFEWVVRLGNEEYRGRFSLPGDKSRTDARNEAHKRMYAILKWEWHEIQDDPKLFGPDGFAIDQN